MPQKAIRGVYDGEVVRLLEPIKVRKGTDVVVTFPEGRKRAKGATERKGRSTAELEKDPLFHISRLAVETGVRDLAAQHDHYLYGTPKR